MEGFARRSRESRPTDTKDPCSKTKDDDSEGRGGEKYLVDDTRFHEKVGTTSLSLSLSLSLAPPPWPQRREAGFRPRDDRHSSRRVESGDVK